MIRYSSRDQLITRLETDKLAQFTAAMEALKAGCRVTHKGMKEGSFYFLRKWNSKHFLFKVENNEHLNAFPVMLEWNELNRKDWREVEGVIAI